MQASETLHTDQLIGARVRAEDFGELRRLYQDRQVMATLSADGNPLPEEETRQRLQRQLDHWDRYGFGMWLFHDRADGQFVGYAWLRNVTMDGRDEVDLGYATLPGFWDRGLTTEMAGAVLAEGFERLGLADVVCYTLPTNRASRRVMEKNGFTYERDIVYAGLPHVFYRLTAAGWQDSHRSGLSLRHRHQPTA